MIAKLRTLLMSLAAVFVLAGCYDFSEGIRSVTVYEPGVYKGAADPLLTKSMDPQFKEALRTRFRMVQTDR